MRPCSSNTLFVLICYHALLQGQQNVRQAVHHNQRTALTAKHTRTQEAIKHTRLHNVFEPSSGNRVRPTTATQFSSKTIPAFHRTTLHQNGPIVHSWISFSKHASHLLIKWIPFFLQEVSILSNLLEFFPSHFAIGNYLPSVLAGNILFGFGAPTNRSLLLQLQISLVRARWICHPLLAISHPVLGAALRILNCCSHWILIYLLLTRGGRQWLTGKPRQIFDGYHVSLRQFSSSPSLLIQSLQSFKKIRLIRWVVTLFMIIFLRAYRVQPKVTALTNWQFQRCLLDGWPLPYPWWARPKSMFYDLFPGPCPLKMTGRTAPTLTLSIFFCWGLPLYQTS